MNRKQVNIVWISATLLLPCAYLIVEELSTTSSKISSNYSIISQTADPSSKSRKYIARVVDPPSGRQYLIKTDSSFVSEAFMVEQIKHLEPLTEQQIRALDENDKLKTRRQKLAKLSVIGGFLAINVIGLLLYNSSKVKEANPTPPQAPSSCFSQHSDASMPGPPS